MTSKAECPAISRECLYPLGLNATQQNIEVFRPRVEPGCEEKGTSIAAYEGEWR
jgi:hypothetical protein